MIKILETTCQMIKHHQWMKHNIYIAPPLYIGWGWVFLKSCFSKCCSLEVGKPKNSLLLLNNYILVMPVS